MPWKETSPMVEKSKFVALVKSGALTMTQACEAHGISRKTGYKWLARFELAGLEGLRERSRAPRRRPRKLRVSMRERLISLRRRRMRWGPRKLLAWLRAREPELRLPAASTVGDLLKREGLVKSRRRAKALRASPTSLQDAHAPNDCWCVDFKGQFTVNNQFCYPLTATDAFSRFVLGCTALDSTRTESAKAVFIRLFEEYGLPNAIRSDNGAPFASAGLGGLTQLSAWWVRLGIRLERIPPGQPQHNGRHERMHRTLKAETASPPSTSMVAQQRRFDAFRMDFNIERPHEALNNEVPASVYEPSSRAFPRVLPDLEYPSHFDLRRVRPDGSLKLASRNPYLSRALIGHVVGLEETDDLVWRLYFGSMLLGVIDGQDPRRFRILSVA